MDHLGAIAFNHLHTTLTRSAVSSATANQPFVFSPGATPVAATGADPLVNETRREIAEIVREVAAAVRSDRTADEFLSLLVDRILRAMAAEGVMVWRRQRIVTVIEQIKRSKIISACADWGGSRTKSIPASISRHSQTTAGGSRQRWATRCRTSDPRRLRRRCPGQSDGSTGGSGRDRLRELHTAVPIICWRFSWNQSAVLQHSVVTCGSLPRWLIWRASFCGRTNCGNFDAAFCCHDESTQ